LNVEAKARRVTRYHAETIDAAVDLMSAAGLASPEELRPWHITRRVSSIETRHYGEIVDYLEPGALLGKPPPRSFERAWNTCSAMTFEHVLDPRSEMSGGSGRDGETLAV
jgi:hypothetical protein